MSFYFLIVIFLNNYVSLANSFMGNIDDAIEVLQFEIMGKDVNDWITVDHSVWTLFLQKQDGYISKSVLVDEMCEYETTSNCVVWSVVHWSSLTQWKSISSDESAKIDETFNIATSNLTWTGPQALPGNNGFAVAMHDSDCTKLPSLILLAPLLRLLL